MTEPQVLDSSAVALRPTVAPILENPPRISGVEADDVVAVLDNPETVELLKAWRDAKKQRALWEDFEEKLKGLVDEVMGRATVGLVNGKPAVIHRPTMGFRGKDFRKEMPALAKAYTIKKEEEVLDVGLLRQAQPDIWQQFCSQPLILSYED